MSKIKDLSTEDKSLWKSYTRHVKAIHKDHSRTFQAELSQDQNDDTCERFEDLIDGKRIRSSKVPSSQNKDPDYSADLKHPKPTQHVPNTLSRQQLRKLTFEATLDLHGMTQNQAYDALGAFLNRSHVRNFKVVLVITGKGMSNLKHADYHETVGVLKREVPKWLSVPPLSHVVRSFTHATQKDGGSGALYVFLKK